MNNLAEVPELNSLKKGMKRRMETMLRDQNDPRMFGNGDIFNTYKYSTEKGWNYYERFMAGEFTMADTEWVNPSDKEEQPLD